MKLVTSILLLLSSILLNAQGGWVKFLDGGPLQRNEVYDILYDEESNQIVSMINDIDSSNFYSLLLMSVDTFGIERWSRKYVGDGTNDYIINERNVIKKNEDKLSIFCNKFYDKQRSLIYFDLEGNVIEEAEFNLANEDRIAITCSHFYLNGNLFMTNNLQRNSYEIDINLNKLENGSVLDREVNFGENNFKNDRISRSHIINGNQILLAGTQGKDYNSTPVSDWERHFYMVITDEDGNVLREIVNDSDIKEGLVSEVVHYYTEEGEERLAFGCTRFGIDTLAQDLTGTIRYLITDIEGNILHSTEIGNDLTQYNYLSYNQKVDDGFIVAGQMILDDLSARLPVVGRLDEEADTIWWQSYDINDRESFYDKVEITGMDILPSGSIFLCGNLEEFSDGFNSINRPFIMKLDKHGCLEPGCRTDVSTDDETLVDPLGILYPNPGKDSFTFQSQNNGSIKIFNTSGKLLNEEIIISGSNSIDCSSYSSGLYIIQFDDGNSVNTYKWIKY